MKKNSKQVEVFTKGGIELLSDKVILETVFNTDDKQAIKDYAKAAYIDQYAIAMLSDDPESLQALKARLNNILS